MTTLRNKHGSATVINDHLVLLRMHEGIEVNAARTQRGMTLIADSMPGNYGMIIERTADYSTAPVEVFQTLREIPSLKVIAIVAPKSSRAIMTNLEKRLFQKPLAVFTTVSEATDWIEETFQQLKQNSA